MDSVDPAQLRRWDLAQESPSAPTVTGHALSIDVELARSVVARLEAVARSVGDVVRSLDFQRVVAPAADDVSQNIALQGARMVRWSRDYLVAWHEDVVRAVDALGHQVDAYEAVDRDTAARA